MTKNELWQHILDKNPHWVETQEVHLTLNGLYKLFNLAYNHNRPTYQPPHFNTKTPPPPFPFADIFGGFKK